jgi:hypothetical protein
MHMRLVHLWSARAKHAVIMPIPSSTLPRRAVYFSDGITPRLPLLASAMAKVSSVCTRENSQPALSDSLSLVH